MQLSDIYRVAGRYIKVVVYEEGTYGVFYEGTFYFVPSAFMDREVICIYASEDTLMIKIEKE